MTIRRAVLLLGTILLCTAGVAFLNMRMPPVRSARSAPPASVSRIEGREEENTLSVFPSLDPARITAISIRTPQSAFEFSQRGGESVSINGQLGDAGVFATLLDHIAAMDYMPLSPFTTDEAPLLTVVVHQDKAQYTASFYGDGATGEHARIAAAHKDGVAYGMTDGWRVGTLLLACEGTRIQDESGRETPAE